MNAASNMWIFISVTRFKSGMEIPLVQTGYSGAAMVPSVAPESAKKAPDLFAESKPGTFFSP
jgi:hypothetical protein